MNYSFKQFVENKDLNEVGQYVFGQGENMPSVATSYKGSDFPHHDSAGDSKHDDYQVYDKNNANLGAKYADQFTKQSMGKSIFNVSVTPSGSNISFTEEMKQHLNNNNKKVDMGEKQFFGKNKHKENEMIGSIGKSMLAAAGSILDNQLRFAYTDFRKMKNTRTVSLEPIFEFLSQGMKGNVSVFKILFPLFERGLKKVVYELNQKIKKDAEKFKKEKHSSGISTYDAITKGSSTNNPNKYFNKTNIELKGYNVIFSVTDDAFSPYKINPPDDFGNDSDAARKLKQSRYKPAFQPPTA
jgi:hypothetical protein